MHRQCGFLSYEEESSSGSEWDEAIGARAQQAPSGEEGPARPYCQCGKGLRRVAKVPGHALLLACASSYDCERCSETILPGEMHFRCTRCDGIKVCKDCGPGVYISRKFDYFDRMTGESNIQEIPDSVIHQRKARTQRKKKSRSVMLDEGGSEEAQALAQQVVQNAKRLCEQVMHEGADQLDTTWAQEGMLQRLLGTAPGEEADAMRLLADAARTICTCQPMVPDVKVPCKVYGDIHGQLRDLLLLCGSFGFPGTPECPSVIFNGDFVDRGAHQVEVCATLFALKIVYPDHIFLNRGNHEDPHMNAKYGFQKACFTTFGERGPEIFEAITAMFVQLPLASLIADKILVVHGGIGDGKWTIADLRKVRRPIGHAQLASDEFQWLWNILWSDPIEDDQLGTSVFGVHSSPRGKLAVKFGWNVTQAFCAKNGIDLVIRSHQAKKGGLGFDVMHNEALIRVFSARDYEGHHNDSAILSIADSEEVFGESGGVLTVRPQVLSALSRDA